MNPFEKIIGQEKLIAFLHSVAVSGQMSHAYLFLGPKGVGKFLVAKALAEKIILGHDSQAQVLLANNAHPDMLIIERESNKSLIAKDRITKDLEPWLAYNPYRAAHRIVIIRDAHLLSLEAANAILKTLEEPPVYACLILVADENNLLETISSRCQMIRFPPISDNLIKEQLIIRGVNDKQADLAVKVAQGSLGKALLLSDDENEITRLWQSAFDCIQKLINGNKEDIFNVASQMDKEAEELSEFMVLIIRDLCIFGNNSKIELLLRPEHAKLWPDFDSEAVSNLMHLLPKIIELRNYLNRNINSLMICNNIAFLLWEVFNKKHKEG